MALERPPKTGKKPGTRSLAELKRYSPPADTVGGTYTIGRKADRRLETLADAAAAAGKINGCTFWEYIEFIFPGCESKPQCVNWFLRHRYECPETSDGKNRRFRGGEQLPLPKPKTKPPAPPPTPPVPIIPGHYRRDLAANWGRRFAVNGNPFFPEPSNGSDCTNFVSQCLFAGGWPMVGGTVWDFNNDDAWWHGLLQRGDYEGGLNGVIDYVKDRIREPLVDAHERYRSSHTWAGASNFHRFIVKSRRGRVVPNVMDLEPGDVIQLVSTTNRADFKHSMIVIGKTATDIEYAQHTENKIAFFHQRFKSGPPDGEEFVFIKMNDMLGAPAPKDPGRTAPSPVRRGTL